MDDLISVLMSVYSESIEHLKMSIDSIRKQTYRNIEILIISDNPLNDEANNYLKSLPLIDSRIKVFFNEKNLRLPRSHNKLMKQAKGKYFAHMDADDISELDRLEKELKFLKENNLDLVSSNVLDIDLNGNKLGTGTNYPRSDENIKRFLKYADCLPSSAWLCKSDVFYKLKGYRNIVVCEDYDLLLRGALLNFRYGLFKEPLVYYRYNPNGVSKKKSVLLDVISIYMQKKYSKYQTFTLSQLKDFVNSNEAKVMKSDIEEYYALSKENRIRKLGKLFVLFIRSKTIRFQIKKKVLRKISNRG